MTTKQRTRPGTTSGLPSKARLFVAVLIAAVAAAIVAALAFGNNDIDDANRAAAALAQIPTDGATRQVSPAQASTTLPRFEGNQLPDPAMGMAAPTITGSHFNDTEVSIDFEDGQPRVVIFLAHWCPHCQAEVSSLVERFETEGIRSDVELLAVSTSVDEGAPNYPPSRWLKQEAWPIPVLRDSQTNDLAAAFGLSGLPFAAAVNGNGEVVARFSGALPETQWDSFIDQALN